LRAYKPELAKRVDGNELEQWAEAKFRKEQWGRLNNNVIESLKNWMRHLQPMPMSWLVSVHLEKLRKEFGRHKELTSGSMAWVSELSIKLQTRTRRWDVWLPWSATV